MKEYTDEFDLVLSSFGGRGRDWAGRAQRKGLGVIIVFAFNVFLRKSVTLPISLARKTWGAFSLCLCS